MKNVNCFPKLCRIYSAIRAARIVCAYLPDRFRKAVQHLRAFMLLPDLRLIERETELLSNRRWEARHPIKRVDKPNQFAQLFRLLGHHVYYMPKLAYSDYAPKDVPLIRATN